jgi:hypothetical protein
MKKVSNVRPDPQSADPQSAKCKAHANIGAEISSEEFLGMPDIFQVGWRGI